MKTKRNKPKELEPEDEDEQNFELICGDLGIKSRGSLQKAQDSMRNMLRDPYIMNYLSFYQRKKMFVPSMIS